MVCDAFQMPMPRAATDTATAIVRCHVHNNGPWPPAPGYINGYGHGRDRAHSDSAADTATRPRQRREPTAADCRRGRWPGGLGRAHGKTITAASTAASENTWVGEGGGDGRGGSASKQKSRVPGAQNGHGRGGRGRGRGCVHGGRGPTWSPSGTVPHQLVLPLVPAVVRRRCPRRAGGVRIDPPGHDARRSAEREEEGGDEATEEAGHVVGRRRATVEGGRRAVRSRGALSSAGPEGARAWLNGRRKPSKVRYIWVVQYGLSTGQKTFFSAAATSSNHTFYSFRRFLNFLRTVFKYGLWCMVSRGGSMDQSLGGIFRPKQSSEK